MDLILSQFNLDSPLPTFFEMRAQEELMPLLSSGFRYGMTVTAQRLVPLAKVVPWSEEIFAVLWALLDYKFLKAIDSTFSENFYGLKRAVAPPGADIMKDIEKGEVRAYHRLTKRHRILSVLLSVLLPYIRAKLTEHMWRCKEEEGTAAESNLSRRRLALRRVYKKVYPYVHFAFEIVTCVYWLRYLFESPWWSPYLHANRILLRRLDRADYVALQSSPHTSLLERTGNFILWTIVCFRVLEWWNSTEAARDDTAGDAGIGGGGATASGLRGSLPPPPAPSEVASATISTSECPHCKHSVTNPTLNAATGIVYCYPCIHQYVEHHAEDPVTRSPCTLDHLRRIYETSA